MYTPEIRAQPKTNHALQGPAAATQPTFDEYNAAQSKRRSTVSGTALTDAEVERLQPDPRCVQQRLHVDLHIEDCVEGDGKLARKY